MEDKEVYRIIDRETEEFEGVRSMGYHKEYDFFSSEHARSSNCHDVYEDRKKYRIDKYKVTYTKIEDDCGINDECNHRFVDHRMVDENNNIIHSQVSCRICGVNK